MCRFYLSFPTSILMFFTFLLELTYEAGDKRSKIYKTELTKVFFSIVIFYLIAILFSNWIQSLRKFIVKV